MGPSHVSATLLDLKVQSAATTVMLNDPVEESPSVLQPQFRVSKWACLEERKSSPKEVVDGRLLEDHNSSRLRHRGPKHVFDVQRSLALKTRATSSEETASSIEIEELLGDLKHKWDAIENKSTVFFYGGGAIVALWLSSILIGAINSVPLLPKILELVGLGYTGWFVYRCFLFKHWKPLLK